MSYSAERNDAATRRGLEGERTATGVPNVELSQWATAWYSDFARLSETGVDAGSAQSRSGLWAAAFPLSYREAFSPAEAMRDVGAIEEATDAPGWGPAVLSLAFHGVERAEIPRLKIISRTELALDDFVPPLRDLGITVLDEHPYELSHPDGRFAWIYDLGLRAPGLVLSEDQQHRIIETLMAVWSGSTESDAYSRLVTSAGLAWPEAAVLRAYSRYLRQAGLNFSHDRVARILANQHQISRHLIAYYGARFDPAHSSAARSGLMAAARIRLDRVLEGVIGSDDDQIVRSFMDVIHATVRTNSYQVTAEGARKRHIAFKIAGAGLPLLPEPRPLYESWVYAPHMEAIHLRFGSVARGGICWSDRREDFRSEVLDLVKAQVVRNAVIVPAGAQGGFFCKAATGLDSSELRSHGQEAYRTFIHGLLDITDNLVFESGRTIVGAPPRVVRHDGNDAYLVVTDGKGTSGFSGMASQIAEERGFWLGNAIAGDGSAVGDRTAGGATARGAWESVRRHFREMALEFEAGSIDTIGIGDMSSDIFGNAMLYSDRIALKAAFDHRHIFVDPSPNAAATFRERARLFALEHSSWADFDTRILSSGGRVYSRRAKAVRISEQAASALGYEGPLTMKPDQLIRVILRSPATLLYHGDSGTYVKSSKEPQAVAADRDNVPVRIDADELRVKVLAEAGSPAITSQGRIQAAMLGVRLNTDAIDSSAGIDWADHEVNIKILLNGAVATGELTPAEGAALLAEARPSIACSVLNNSYEQNYAIGTTVNHKPSVARVFARAMTALEKAGRLDRSADALPPNEEIARRVQNGQRLTRPEISVVMAHIKSSLRDRLLVSSVPDEPWAQRELEAYFPREVVARTRGHLGAHPLRREIISTVLANKVVNHAGITFVFRLCEETGATEHDAVRAYFIAAEIWGQQEFFNEIRALDGLVAANVQDQLDRVMRRLLDRSSRWFLKNQVSNLSLPNEVARFAVPAAELSRTLLTLLHPSQAHEVAEISGRLQRQGVPAALAGKASALLYRYPLLDVVAASARTGGPPEDLAATYFDLFEQIEGRKLLRRIDALPRNDPWETMARASLREDFYDVLSSAAHTLSMTGTGTGSAAPADHPQLVASRLHLISDALQELSDADAATDRDFEILSVILRALRSLSIDAFKLAPAPPD